MYRVFINPGHGGSDSGAVAINGLYEKNINLNVSLDLKKMLLVNGNFIVNLSRETDVFVSITDAAKKGNAFKPDLGVSIHHNAGGGRGFDVIHSIDVKDDKFMALLTKHFKLSGIKEHKVFTRVNATGHDYYGIIRQSKFPMCITEYAFLDNAEDLKNIDERHEHEKEATMIYNAICEYFNVPTTPKSIKPNTTTPIPNKSVSVTPVAPISTAITKTLRKGDKGADVIKLQQALIKINLLKAGQADGDFGPITDTAVKAFQKANKLTVDGIVGPNTLKILKL